LALPLMLGQLGQMAMGLVDTALVGRVSERDLAAVALGNTLVFLTFTPAFGLAGALEPVVAQAFGGRDPSSARLALREGTRLAWILTPILMLLCYASTWLLPLFRVAPDVVPGARGYVIARLPSLLPYLLFLTHKTYQQAASRPRAALEAVVVANVAHFIFGYVAVFGDAGLLRLHLPALGIPRLGGTGAGLTTSVSAFLMAAWVLGPRGRPPEGAVDAEPSTAPVGSRDRAMQRKLLRLGLPIGLQLSAEVGIFSLVALLMGHLGGRAAAAHQVALSLAATSFMGAMGIAQATSVRVGHWVGQGQRHAARRAGALGIALGLLIMSVSAVVFALAPRALASVFTSEPPVLDAAVALVRIAAVFQLGDGAQVVAAGALRGAGDTRWPLLLNIVVHWCFALPVACTFAFVLHRGPVGLWYGLSAGLLTIGAALVARFFVLTRVEIRRV